MMRSLVDDIERYVDPQEHTPSHHERVAPARRFYVVNDHVYVGESLAHELAARRRNPLLVLDDTVDYPEAFISTDSETYSFAHFLAESSHREVVVCIPDITDIPDDCFDILLESLSTCEFNPQSNSVRPHYDNPSEREVITGTNENLILIASEPDDQILGELSPETRSQFGVRVDPERHDGYTGEGFNRL